MNKTTHAIFTLLHYSLLLRDTLEYTLVKEEGQYNVEMYKERKRVLLGSLDNQTQLSEFLKHNGETGEKIDRQLREFIDEIYGDNSTVLHVGAEGLRVDHSQHIKIYNYVIGLYETLSDIIYGHLNFAKSQNEFEQDFADKIEANNKFYRALAYMVITRDLTKTFKEFNDAMRETNGQPSPQSNFISNDLSQLVGFLGFVRNHSGYDRNQPKADEELITMFDATENIIAKMNGRIKLQEGENLFKESEDNTQAITQLVAKLEKVNNENLAKLFEEVTAFEKQLMEEAKAAKSN